MNQGPKLKALLKRQEGFTLIELLAVMAIVAALAGIVAVQVSGSGDTSKDVQTQQDATTVSTAVVDFFSDQEGAVIEIPRTVTVFGEEGIIITTDSHWPEIPITANLAYRNVFQETRSQIAAISLFDEEGNPSVLSVRGLLQNYNAVDFFALIDGGYLQAPPDGAELFTKDFSNYLWLLKKETVASGGGAVASREVEVFKLVTVQQVEGSGPDVLAYRRLVGETIVNELPAASAQNVKAGVSTPKQIALTGSDPDGDPLTFIVITQPDFGSVSDVSGTSPQVNYIPPAFEVTDSFAFKVFDGISDSAPALVSIEVTSGGAAEDPPPNFEDEFPPNKIDDLLDIAIFLSPSSPFDVVVTFSSAFINLHVTVDPGTGIGIVDEAALGLQVGALVDEPSGVFITAVTLGNNAASMTLTGSKINTLAEADAVIRIEEDTVFSFPGF